MSDFGFDLPDGRRLNWWRNPTGDEWACLASDHGAFCRLCQPVDDTTRALLGGLREGAFDVKIAPDGELVFKLTEFGQARAESYINTVEGADLWARLSQLDPPQESSDA